MCSGCALAEVAGRAAAPIQSTIRALRVLARSYNTVCGIELSPKNLGPMRGGTARGRDSVNRPRELHPGRLRVLLEIHDPCDERARRRVAQFRYQPHLAHRKRVVSTRFGARQNRYVDIEIAEGRAAGMRDARTRQRYLSLRGSELADMLG